MCLIVTIVMLILAIQNLLEGYFMIGSLQLVIAFVFLFLLWRNIQQVRCDKKGCASPNWVNNIFKREEK